jgi:hypothetical protein
MGYWHLSLALLVAACGAASNDEPGESHAETSSSADASGVGGAANSGGAGGRTASGAGNGGVASADTGVGGTPTVGTRNDGATVQREACSDPVMTGRPDGAPELSPDTWTNISPPDIPYGDNGTIALGIAVDPCHPTTLYDCITSFDPEHVKTGLYKSTDAGGSWRWVARLPNNPGGSDHIDNPIRVRVDPKNPDHLYVADGVRGGSGGFWVSTDGGETFTMPESFVGLKTTENLYPFDVYDVAPDPTDFEHVLLTFHGAWGWTDTKWNAQSGILESTDGGQTWIVHEPLQGWGYGNVANFLFEPALGMGDSRTWLFGSPGGLWRTSDGGASWTKPSEAGVQHGGGTIYYAKGGQLYAAGGGANLRSTDNGITWTETAPSKGYNAIFGDGVRLYTAPCFGPTPFLVSKETDGTTWSAMSSQEFGAGPYEMAIDSVNGVLYSSSWGSGVFALAVPR